MPFPLRFLAGFGLLGWCCAGAVAQQPVAVPVPAVQPLQKMPYSPSLDIRDMDRTADPCVNFYQYSCGGWMRNNPIPADQASWDVYAKLTNENQQFLWGILQQDAAASGRTPVQQKVGDYFQSCMDTAAIEAAGLHPLQPELARLDGLSTREALAAELAPLSHLAPGSYFFSAGTGQDAVDASKIIVEVRGGGLGLPDRDYYTKVDPKSVEIRRQYLEYIQKLLTLAGEPAAQATAEAAAILRIETALATAQLTRVERRDPHKTYHLLTLNELHGLTPAIDWRRYFAVDGAPNVERLNVAQPAFMKAVQAELTGEPLPALKAYLRFHLLTAEAPYLPQRFEQANFEFYSHTLRGVAQEPPRWKTCVRGVNRDLGEALGQEFVARTFTADMKARTELMTGQIEEEMGKEIAGLNWMSPQTKAQALQKLHAIRNKVGYPAHWRDYGPLDIQRGDYFGNVQRAYAFDQAYEWHKLGHPVDLNEWGMTPPTVNAYFDPQKNDINFPAGVLQPPLYDPSLDDAPNYGDTGATIGHELTHAFDDEGRQFDAAGNLRDWWTPADAKAFDERIGCVRDQYAGFVVIDDIHINSRLTSGEDVADLGGTYLAFLAWKLNEEGKTLHPIDGFTPDQRFFIGMAQWACGNTRPAMAREQAITDPHSPAFARINGVVSNMPEFAKAFSCKAGQPMVHQPRCKVW